MEVGYIAVRNLIPILMEWVSKSRIQNHLKDDSTFITWLGDDMIQFNLSNLTDHYQVKHIHSNLSVYALSLIENISPTLIQWCQRYNIQQVEMGFRFKTEKGIYSVTRVIKAKKIDREAQKYLANKST